MAEVDSLKQFLTNILALPDSDWKAFSALFKETTLSKDHYFAEEGKVENTLGFLTDGVMRAFFRNKEGAEYSKTFFEPGEFVAAYSSMVTGQVNRINLQALTDCTLLVADYRKVEALYDTHPSLERLARRIAEWYYVYKEKREIEIVLLDATERYELFKKEYPTLENKITQYHIASYLGITPTQLSRIRAKK